MQLYGDCPHCGQYIMIPDPHSHELCPSCFRTVYIYNDNFLTESEYSNGENVIQYIIEDITEKVIQNVTEEEHKKWYNAILLRTEFNKKSEKQKIEHQNVYKKAGGVGTNPLYHIKNYLTYIKQTDDERYQCILCGFIGETPRPKEKVKNHLITCHLIKISLIKPKIKKNGEYDINKRPKLRQFLKPWHDPESLFCDTKFLRQFLGKEPAKESECKDQT